MVRVARAPFGRLNSVMIRSPDAKCDHWLKAYVSVGSGAAECWAV